MSMFTTRFPRINCQQFAAHNSCDDMKTYTMPFAQHSSNHKFVRTDGVREAQD